MKHLFFAFFGFLALWSIVSFLTLPDIQTEKPVIYWVTDSNPARKQQVAKFHAWMAENNFPEVELRVDTSNNESAKKIIQGVSGVAGDLLDAGVAQVSYFKEIGIASDITELGLAMGFSPEKTYSALRPTITQEGRQYSFPCNVSCRQYIINKDTFATHGLPIPPHRWDLDTFETLGREFVEKANAGLRTQKTFFADQLEYIPLWRSMGLSLFNETLTACTLDDERYIELLKRAYKWTYEDRIIPSAADVASFATDTGYGGSTLQLFYSGNFGMISSGRYAVIQFREFETPINLGVTEYPNAGFPNSVIRTRCPILYRGSPHRQLAAYFLKFLASPEYNRLIVEDGDALPPDPAIAETEAFTNPPEHPNEWDFHRHFRDSANETAIPVVVSPFVLMTVTERIELRMREGFMAGIYTAEEAAIRTAQEINREIQLTIEKDDELRNLYETLKQEQRMVDSYKAEGQPVPKEFIHNAFHLAYQEAHHPLISLNTENGSN